MDHELLSQQSESASLRPSWKRLLNIALRVSLGVAFAATVCAPLLKSIWLLDLLTQFRVYWIPVLIVLLVLFLSQRQRYAALVAFGTAIFCISSLLRYSYGGDGDKLPTSPPLKVISYNIRASSRDATDILNYLRSESADVVLLIEVKSSWLRKLGELRAIYPHEVAEPRPGAQGMWLLSRFPIRMVDEEGVSTAIRYPYISALIDTPGGTVRFVGTHPSVPISLSGARIRNSQMKAFAEIAQSSTEPVIVAGDFNCTPFSGHFRSLLNTGGLKDSAVGFGFRNTWRRNISILPIDHVLVSEGILIASRQVGPRMESDHHPLVVELHLPD